MNESGGWRTLSQGLQGWNRATIRHYDELGCVLLHGGEYRNGSENQPHVDIGRLPDWSGFFVGWMAAGEWLRYETIAGGRNYRPRFRYSRGVSGDGSVTLSLDGTAVATLNLPSTGSWDTYTTSSLGTQFYMPPGYHHLTVSTSTGSINIDWFELVP